MRRARRAALFWALFLFTLTSWPRPPRLPIVSGISHFDKLVHFFLYAVQAFLLYRAISWPGRSGFSLGRALAVVGTMAVWGMADEVHQTWIPDRSTEAGDVAADVLGAAAGASVASLGDRQSRRARRTAEI